MIFKKSVCLVGSILATSTAFAVENNSTEAAGSASTRGSKINLDILAGIGYTSYSQIKIEDSNSSSGSGSGFNVNASALYSIMETKIGSPVVGLGINYGQVVSKDNKESLNVLGVNVDTNSKLTISTLSLVANAGFKFTPAPKFAIFTLANLGYGAYNSLKVDTAASAVGFNPSVSNDTKINNHFLYGVSVIGTYEVVNNFSVGLGLTYNRHSFKMDSVTSLSESSVGYNATASAKSNIALNEYSANLTASYSL